MFTKKILISIAGVCLINCPSFSQSPSDRQNFLPKVVPSSPETMMMQRFGNYSVSMFSGLPEISIPLYEINTGKLKVPVILSYHASGIRVTDEASWVGLGWNLSAGGAISRTVMSKADEQPNGYLNSVSSYIIRSPTSLDAVNNGEDLNYSNNVARGLYDLEPDIYSCNLPTINCKFYYADRNITKPVIIPFNPLKLTSSITGNDFYFNIKDESGIQYNLGIFREITSSGSSLDSYATAWNLSQMISNDKTDTISFNYTGNGYQGGGGDFYDVTTVTDLVTNVPVNACGYEGNCNCQSSVSTTSGGGQASGIGGNVLQEIRFPQGKIVFELETVNRLDLANKNLKSVKIYTLDPVAKNYTLLKSYSFFYNYFINGTERRLKLQSLQLNDQINSALQTYSFVYNETMPLPLKGSRARDYWGYYNGKNNSSLIPRMTVDLLGPNGGVASSPLTIGSNIEDSREPDPAFNQAGILTKITYPTGGTSEFTYETNQYQNNTNQVKFAGGLRIRQIKNIDPASGNINYKTYKYGITENGYGNLIIPINLSYYSAEQLYYFAYDVQLPTRRIRNFISNPSISFEPFDGNIVGYTEVAEFNGTESNNSGKSIYTYTCPYDNYGSLIWFNKPKVVSRHYERGLLISKTDYKNAGNGNFIKVHSTANSYGAFAGSSVGAVNLTLFERNTFQYQQFRSGGCASPSNFPQPYAYSNYIIMTGDNRIISNTETVYDESDQSKYTATATTYSYGNFAHMQVTKTTTYDSNNEMIETLFSYPTERSGEAVPKKMILANMLNQVLDKEIRKNNVRLSLQHNEYAEWAVNHYYPSYTTTQIKTNLPETEVTFNSYDNLGNVTKYTGRDGIATSFIWDYGLNYPIAKVNNASLTDIAYTSFEGDGTGNWENVTKSNILNELRAFSGSKLYNFNGSVLSKSGLNSSSTYIVSYWSNSGMCAVSGTSVSGWPKSLNSVVINGLTWNLWEHRVNGTSTISVSGTGFIDEMRLYLLNAQMTSYTYVPLLGLSSVCDINNKTNYYEYDTFGRLKLIRDFKKNIIQTYNYKYQSGTP